MKKNILNNFPFVPQRDKMDCGIACIAMICKYYGKYFTHLYIEKLSSLTKEGVSMLNISDTFTKLGIDNVVVESSYKDFICNHIFPCVLYWNQNHFVVLYKIKEKKQKKIFHIADPAHGLIRLNEDEFKKLWIKNNIGYVLYTEPTEEQIAEYTKRAEEFRANKEALKALKDKPSVSVDGHKVELVGNIGSPADVDAVNANGGEGVGLFRTEFLYMKSENDFPNEDMQFAAYKSVLEGMNGKQVVIRTLDIGGDKKLSYYQFEEEMNPFLGVRAVRFCLSRKDIFRVQLRALLRASAFGKLCIMFPMIATVAEFREAKAVYDEERAKLIAEGVTVGDVQVGIMIEIPAAAVLADQLAKEADFFSIGTNDLIQYSMAADRMSQPVSYLYQPLNPSVLRLIKMAIDGAHKEGKWCGMCGEMAGDELAAPILLGLGLDEFSMSATSILPARKIINSLSYAEMKELAEKAVASSTEAEVVELIKNTISK